MVRDGEFQMNTTADSEPFKCSPLRAMQSVTEGPNWAMNLLWLSLAVLLQQFIVGSIFAFGYGSEIIQARAGHPSRTNPDIDVNRLGDTFMRGLWPFLVYLIGALAVGLLAMIPIFVILAIGLFLFAASSEEVAFFGIAIFVFPVAILVNLLSAILVGPLCIRAMICQDFQKSFDLAWIRSFIRLVGFDMLISSIIFGLLSIPVIFLGLLLFCIGLYPAMGLLTAAAFNLLSQWYELFLLRGGEPVEPGGNAIIDATVVSY